MESDRKLAARTVRCVLQNALFSLWLSKHVSTPDNIPSAVYIFEFSVSPESFMPRLRTVLLHTQPVLHARWNPVRKGNLALCCGIQSVYIWSDEWQGDSGEEEMAECIGVPASTSDLKL